MSVLKTVWRMNGGRGVPSDLGSEVLHEKYGFIRGNINTHPAAWHLKKDGRNITAYQTTRTSEAKYDRVECENCYGRGDMELHSMLNTGADICKDCYGKGWKLERVK